MIEDMINGLFVFWEFHILYIVYVEPGEVEVARGDVGCWLLGVGCFGGSGTS